MTKIEKVELAELGLRKLKMRFQTKIIPEEYYLSYSGGKDSHLIYWFIKEYMNLNIKVVALNTYREHREIRKRMYQCADEVIYPTMKMQEIKEKYGSPCFSKMQDEIIERYQKDIYKFGRKM
jgi:3'-phosphoadenosine 5'-phosphosulfate sulfotransferase (PAPS reductase)/FAD synthetase